METLRGNAAEPHTSSQEGLVELIAEIIRDARTLLLQEIQLARDEFQEKAGKIATAALSLAVGIGVGLIGSLLLILMFVHLLKAFTELPMWACYGIVGGVLLILGLALLFLGMKWFKQIQLVPARTLATLKENVRWFKEMATSSRT